MPYILSVIIPCYNAARYLCTCLDSIVSQLEPDIEVICVNDGSCDSTLAILHKYKARFSSIVVLDIPHGGVATARNTALLSAHGEYIAWVDADDYISSDWVISIKSIIQIYAPDLIVTDTQRFSGPQQEPQQYGRSPGMIDPILFTEDVIRDIRIKGGLPDKIIKSTFYQGLHFDPSLQILEDYALMPQLLRHVQSVYYLPRCLYHYRQHDESLLHHRAAAGNFRSVEIALERLGFVEQRFQAAAVTAAAWQILVFYRSCYLSGSTAVFHDQLIVCRHFLRQHFFTLCVDRELSLQSRCKLTAAGLGIYGPLLKWKHFRTFQNNIKI